MTELQNFDNQSHKEKDHAKVLDFHRPSGVRIMLYTASRYHR